MDLRASDLSQAIKRSPIDETAELTVECLAELAKHAPDSNRHLVEAINELEEKDYNRIVGLLQNLAEAFGD